MRSISLHVLTFVALLAVFYSYSDGTHVSAETSSLTYKRKIDELPSREKRQVESFDDEFPTTGNQEAQEETGFWDRVVRVALKIFSRFVEWLNS